MEGLWCNLRQVRPVMEFLLTAIDERESPLEMKALYSYNVPALAQRP
jgi:hypothetical protein